MPQPATSATARHHRSAPVAMAAARVPAAAEGQKRENRGGGRALSPRAAPPPGQAGLSGSRRPLRFQRAERAPVRPGRHGGGGGGAEAEQRRCVRRPRGCYRRLRPLGFKTQLLPSPFFFFPSPPSPVRCHKTPDQLQRRTRAENDAAGAGCLHHFPFHAVSR